LLFPFVSKSYFLTDRLPGSGAPVLLRLFLANIFVSNNSLHNKHIRRSLAFLAQHARREKDEISYRFFLSPLVSHVLHQKLERVQATPSTAQSHIAPPSQCYQISSD